MRADCRAVLDVCQDMSLQGLALHVRNDARHYIAAALDYSEHHGLARRTTFPLAARALPADHRVVNLDMAVKRIVTVNLAHVLEDFVAHAPSALVGHAKLALEFFGRHAMARRGEQIHGIKPLLERRAGPLEGRSDHW